MAGWDRVAFDEKKAPLLGGIGDLLCYHKLMFWIVDVRDIYDWKRHIEMELIARDRME